MNSMTVSDSLIDNSEMEIDRKYRNNFSSLIIETKKLTHKCQLECYSNNNNLEISENCARNCFSPMLFIKKNITKLTENCKEDLEKCKAHSVSKLHSAKYDSSKIFKCLEKYENDLLKTKDEAEYIYLGYMKNFDDLIKEATSIKNDKNI